jgi:hypothetical protein
MLRQVSLAYKGLRSVGQYSLVIDGAQSMFNQKQIHASIDAVITTREVVRRVGVFKELKMKLYFPRDRVHLLWDPIKARGQTIPKGIVIMPPHATVMLPSVLITSV